MILMFLELLELCCGMKNDYGTEMRCWKEREGNFEIFLIIYFFLINKFIILNYFLS